MKRSHGITTLVCALAIVSQGLPAVPVPPPTDVEVICQNLNVRVRWNYSRAGAQSSFTITLKGTNGCFVERSTVEHQYDLTHDIWSSEDTYMSNFHVLLTATVGGIHSEPALSRSFTFSNVETAAMTCQLDFPPVELVRKDAEATLRFSNPFHYYRELKQAVKTDTATFSITINLEDAKVNEDFICNVKEEMCKHNIIFPEGLEHCVRLDGVLFAGDLVGQILFKKSDRICAVTTANILWILLGVLLGIVTTAAILAVVIIVAKRSLIDAPLVFPSVFQWPVIKKLDLWYATVFPEDISMVYATPWLETSWSPSNSYPESRASVTSEQESGYLDVASLGGVSHDEDDEAKPVLSDYDHPHCFEDMGDGDIDTAHE